MLSPPSPFIAIASLTALFGTGMQPGSGDAEGENTLTTPPGMVRIVGNKRVVVGTKLKDAEVLIRAHAGLRNDLIAETPQHTVKLEDFFLMANEVTNEQYEVFVRSNALKPPQHWGQAAVDVGRRAHLEAENRLKQEAKELGERYTVRPFNVAGWWKANWTTSEWALPDGLADHPVVFVDYRDALAFSRWAGLRLMSEFEFQCAARAATDRLYPWGEQWDDNRFAASIHAGKDQTWPVGSFSEGAVEGVFDLAGNVWEWTESRYSRFPGYKPLKFTVGSGKRKRKMEAHGPFEPSWRVLVSGSYKNPRLALRSSTRMGALRSQATDTIGFRCATSIRVCLDAARFVLDEDIRTEVLPADLVFVPEQTVGAINWESRPPAGEGEKENGVTTRVSGYSIITGHDRIFFTPVEKLPIASVRDFRKLTEGSGPVLVGLLSTSIPISEPALEPGTYLVSWRSRGKLKTEKNGKPAATEAEPEKPQEGGTPREEADGTKAFDFTQTPGFIEMKDCFFFSDLQAKPVLAVEAFPLLYDRMRDGSVTHVEWQEPKKKKRLKKGEAEVVPFDTVTLRLAISGKHRNKGFLAELTLNTTPGVIDGTWVKTSR